MDSNEENLSNESKKSEETSCKANKTKTILAYCSIVIGVIGLGLFFAPIPEIICGVGGLVLSIAAKDENASWFVQAVRRYGNWAAWVNISWVCLEFGLKFAGINLF